LLCPLYASAGIIGAVQRRPGRGNLFGRFAAGDLALEGLHISRGVRTWNFGRNARCVTYMFGWPPGVALLAASRPGRLKL
jgi:hypothetical protein